MQPHLVSYLVSRGSESVTAGFHTSQLVSRVGTRLVFPDDRDSWYWRFLLQDLLTLIQVFAIFWKYLSSTGDDINYWVYVLTLDVITGVCNLTRQGRLQKTTTTTRNSTVCLCIFFHVPHFFKFRILPYVSQYFSASRILHFTRSRFSAICILPVPVFGNYKRTHVLLLLEIPNVQLATRPPCG